MPEQPTITKEQAIELWAKFIKSPKVRKHLSSAGHGASTNYLNLIYEQFGKEVARISLRTLYWAGDPDKLPHDYISDLETPYGIFKFHSKEADELRHQWRDRDKQLEQPTYNALLTQL